MARGRRNVACRYRAAADPTVDREMMAELSEGFLASLARLSAYEVDTLVVYKAGEGRTELPT